MTIEHVLKYNQETGDLVSVFSVPGGGPPTEGIIEGEEPMCYKNYETRIEGSWSYFMERYYIDGGGNLVDRGAKTNELQTWNGTAWEITLANFLADVRRKRDSLLFQSDWTQIPDSTLNEDQKSHWRTYRQNLRDITNDIISNSAPYLSLTAEVAWPTKPE